MSAKLQVPVVQYRRILVVAAWFILAAGECFGISLVTGCAARGPKTYPVSGQVEIRDSDASVLIGSNIELAQEGDDNIRPSGKINAVGAYTMQTLLGGKIFPGVPEGKYKVRVILADENDEGVPKRKGDPIHKKYCDFATSGLTVTVPGGDYKLVLSRK